MDKKLKMSPVLLSLLGVCCFYYDWMSGTLFLLAVLLFEVKDEVKINITQYVLVKVVLSLLVAASTKLSGLYTDLIKLFTDDYEVIATAQKFDVFKYVNTLVGWLNLIVIIAFLLVIAKKKVIKVPTLYSAVTKLMTSEE